MPIVIDDFQVEAAPPPQQKRGASDDVGGGSGGGGKEPDAEEIERAFRTQAERAERVWAH